MTTIIANPIYDLAFKYLMEDERVVKILLSALLRKRVVEVTTRRNEVINVEREPISVFRLDFNAVVAEDDGREEHILIELQKTDLPTDLLRFRQYLGTQYLNKENMVGPEKRQHALPMVASSFRYHYCTARLVTMWSAFSMCSTRRVRTASTRS
jgi:hypothetical protein